MIFNSSRFGHDISTYQESDIIAGQVNFTKMRDNGASFVILRSSVGNQQDVDFSAYLKNSRGILPRGIYHYYWNSVSPAEQAQVIITALNGEHIEGRVWLDLENTSAGAYNRPANWRALLQILEAAGYRTGIYTGKFWWDKYAVATGEDLSFFYARPLWEAWYTNYPADVIVAGKWLRMMIWQDSSSYPGASAGVESPTIDHNKWNDDYNFNAEWEAVTPPPVTGATMYEGNAKTTATPNVRLRQANPDGSANPSGTTIGAIQPGQAFKADLLSPDSLWLRITEIGGKTVQALYNKPYGYSATQYLDYHEVIITPPPVATNPDVKITVDLGAAYPVTVVNIKPL